MQPLRYKMCKMIGTHKFLCMPNAPKSLLQRDLLEKLEAEIKFKNGEIQIKVRDNERINQNIKFSSHPAIGNKAGPLGHLGSSLSRSVGQRNTREGKACQTTPRKTEAQGTTGKKI